MSKPLMRVIAGPPGGGKSSVFPIADTGLEYFDADGRAAELNAGSFRNISTEVRRVVNLEFETFIRRHIEQRRSMIFETTLRSAITFEQAQQSRNAGFHLSMRYIALASVELHINRVAARADSGGHSASVRTLREIYSSSLINLRRALREFDDVAVYDNSGSGPQLVLTVDHGRVHFLIPTAPHWVLGALRS